MALVETAAAQDALSQAGPARENFQRAIALLEALPEEYRHRSETQVHLTVCHRYLGYQEQVGKRWDEAERHYRAALAVFERLDREEPNTLEWQNEMARAETKLADCYLAGGRLAEAEAHYLRAVALRTRLVDTHPGDRHLEAVLAETYQNLGVVYGVQKRWPEAQSANDRARGLLEPVVAQLGEYQLSLAAVYHNAGDILRNTGKPAEALPRFTQAVELAEAVLQQEPLYVEARDRAYNAHGARALVCQDLGRWADAVKDWDRLLSLERPPGYWGNRWFRANALARAGDHARAAAELEALEKVPEALAGAPYDLASVYAVAAAAARVDTNLPPPERTALAGHYAGRAMALLKKLQREGFFRNGAHSWRLLTDPEMHALRDRADFWGLLLPPGRNKPK
jgi:tetratricopeptide (TPR) repeat protein